MKAIILLLSIVLLSFSSDNKMAGPTKGSKAPEIEIYSVNGKTVKLSSIKGKMVLIDFWASWCRPCRHETPNVVEAYNKYRKTKFKSGKGFEVFSVSLDRKEDPWLKAIKQDGLVWKSHGWDKEQTAAKDYSITSIPTAYLIDGDGIIVASGRELRGLNLHLTLDKHLK